ncbi:hypothetical protein BJ742DRAFT_710406 [Cladochytrium replicatum]|nr:hypothetical protein BJ742DRAFT_710406 [Cladochytrium replicatum]
MASAIPDDSQSSDLLAALSNSLYLFTPGAETEALSAIVPMLITTPAPPTSEPLMSNWIPTDYFQQAPTLNTTGTASSHPPTPRPGILQPVMSQQLNSLMPSSFETLRDANPCYSPLILSPAFSPQLQVSSPTPAQTPLTGPMNPGPSGLPHLSPLTHTMFTFNLGSGEASEANSIAPTPFPMATPLGSPDAAFLIPSVSINPAGFGYALYGTTPAVPFAVPPPSPFIMSIPTPALDFTIPTPSFSFMPSPSEQCTVQSQSRAETPETYLPAVFDPTYDTIADIIHNLINTRTPAADTFDPSVFTASPSIPTIATPQPESTVTVTVKSEDDTPEEPESEVVDSAPPSPNSPASSSISPPSSGGPMHSPRQFLYTTSICSNAVRNEDGALICPICPESHSGRKTFKTLPNLRAHVRLHHEKGRTLVCDKCNKSFLRKQDLDRHASTHLPKDCKPHVCLACGVGFSRIDAMRAHQRKKCRKMT